MILSANAKPYTFKFDPAKTALLLSKFARRFAFPSYRESGDRDLVPVDFQRDFIEEGGYGEIESSNHLAAVQEAVKPAVALLQLSRRAGLTIVHTREGHEANLTDCPTCKVPCLLPFPWIDDNRSSIAYTASQCS
jgi:hypothetical protein